MNEEETEGTAQTRGSTVLTDVSCNMDYGLLQLRRLFVNNTRSYRVPFSSSQVNLLCLCSCYYPIPLSYPQENYNFILCVSFAVNINPISCEMTFPSD